MSAVVKTGAKWCPHCRKWFDVGFVITRDGREVDVDECTCGYAP